MGCDPLVWGGEVVEFRGVGKAGECVTASQFNRKSPQMFKKRTVILFIYFFYHDRVMATAKTGSFYLTETVTLPSTATDGARVQGSIDLGAYVNVATGQAVAVEQVDFIYQAGADFSQDASDLVDRSATLSVQLTDLNPGTLFVRADDQSLIASGALAVCTAASTATDGNILSHQADIYPDNFGGTNLSEAFMVVNDTLYLVGGINGNDVGASDVFITARIKCRVAKLSSKDWMAIAIQSTASDN